jgi:hypothetical protein
MIDVLVAVLDEKSSTRGRRVDQEQGNPALSHSHEGRNKKHEQTLNGPLCYSHQNVVDVQASIGEMSRMAFVS